MDTVNVLAKFDVRSFSRSCQPNEDNHSDSLGQFKRRLKTHLFGLWDHSALCHWPIVN